MYEIYKIFGANVGVHQCQRAMRLHSTTGCYGKERGFMATRADLPFFLRFVVRSAAYMRENTGVP